MATPRLSFIKMQAREFLRDTRRKSDGAVIAVSTDGGRRYSSTALDDLVVQAINAVFSQVASQFDPKFTQQQRAQALMEAFPEYARTGVQLAAWTIVSPAKGQATLPSDFGYLASAVFQDPSGRRQIMITNAAICNAALEGTNSIIAKGVKGYASGTVFVLVRNDASNPLPSPPAPTDGVYIDYFAQQTTVTDGGATDVSSPARLDTAVVAMMAQISKIHEV